ncbi:UDP-N-acetylglucosamine transporter isoform X2 [Lingula anatina]|uniref:UDP-N-acetylglucosamine transporter isoform X2 n=1 Tax=Lingula anatina TaxID=7574 RepID=A0A1S3JD77_LINAN|nr:UDP-N-acetylglucosamine transporter isoform X2 [Lingula anatina]|eukprot:XP_013408278.1 UDP-N-acetylglucosamine transporter isoform X2 [Lingula anatina]
MVKQGIAETQQSVFQRSLKSVSLVTLTFQNGALTLVSRYARTRPGNMFFSTTAVVMAELFKCVSCLFIIMGQEGGIRPWARRLNEDVFQQPYDCLKISVPAVVYVIQNNLLYVAISNLDAGTFQVTYQLKILTTAVFSVILLQKKLSKIQWVALVMLFTGVAFVQFKPESTSEKVSTEQNRLLGFGAVLLASALSGFAGVYFEKVLKTTKQSLWLRNVQLGFLGVVFGTVTIFLSTDGQKVRDKGFFFGYDMVVWAVVFLQSFGGLLVAVVVKYADNILKGFACSAAIVFASLASVYLFNFQLSLQFVIGACLVCISVFMYGYQPKEKTQSNLQAQGEKI